MATLTANLSSTALDFTVTGSTALAATGTQYRIDDEVITLRAFVREPEPWSPRNRNRWNVSRGQAGTTAATHLAGATIVGIEKAVTTGTTLVEPEPFAGASAGSQQDISLLGPYTVNFDTVGIEDDDIGLSMFTTELDWIILDCWVRIIVPWNNADTVSLDIATRNNFDSLIPGGVDLMTGTEDPFSDLGRRVSANNDKVQSASGKLINAAGDDTTLNPRVVPAHVKTPGEVFAYILRTGSAPAAGQVLIYALIATPAG